MESDDNKKLRELLWLRHGCSTASLYGDDGEMQCGHCLIDFKRLPAAEIEDRFRAMAMQRFVIEVNLNGKKESSKGLSGTSTTARDAELES